MPRNSLVEATSVLFSLMHLNDWSNFLFQHLVISKGDKWM